MSARRCRACWKAGESWCSHRGVLVIFLGGVEMRVLARSQEAARLAADRVSIAMRGRPFHRRESSECRA
jgi:hypothetical protein